MHLYIILTQPLLAHTRSDIYLDMVLTSPFLVLIIGRRSSPMIFYQDHGVNLC